MYSSFESPDHSQEIQMNISLLAHIAADSELQGRFGVQGYVFANTIGYFKSYLTKRPEAYSNLKILTESVEKLHGYARRMQEMAERRASVQEATQFSQEIANKIAILRNGEEVILPGGWSNPASSGHAMIYHFRKEGNVLRFYIYNAGAGVNYHEKISSTSNERYFSTKVYEFKEADAHQLMYLIRRLVVARLNHLHPDFDAEQLYLHNIEEMIPFINDLTQTEPLLAQNLFNDVLTTTGQISGTCTQRSIHQMLKHHFKSLEDYRRFIIDFKIHAINDYLSKHTRCSQPIQELVSYAIINTIKICDTPGLYSFEEKEAKLSELYALQDRLTQLQLQEKAITAPNFSNTFFLRPYNSNLSSPMFELNELSHGRQPIRTIQPVVPTHQNLLERLDGIYQTCLKAEAEGDALWVLKQIEQVFLDLPIPESFEKPCAIYDPFTAGAFEPFIQKLDEFQLLFNKCRKTAFDQNQFVAQATVQMSIMAINDYCHRKYASMNFKPDFSPFFAYLIHSYFKVYTYSPYLASHHALLDDRFQALSSLYAKEERSDDYLRYYAKLIEIFPGLYQKLTDKYATLRPEDNNFDNAIVKGKLQAVYVLCSQYNDEGLLKADSFLNTDEYQPLRTEIQKQWAYECSILRGMSPLFPDRKISTKFRLNMSFVYGSIQFSETFANAGSTLRFGNLTPELTQYQYEVKRPEMKAACHHETPNCLSTIQTKKTSNNIQIQPYDSPTTRVINKEDFFFRDLQHLRTSQRHQASLTLDYFHEVRDYLKDPEIQRYVEGNIFEPRVLSITLEKDKTFLTRFDEFIDSGLKAFVAVNKEMTHEALFFIRLSAYVNRFVAEKSLVGRERLENDYARICDLILSNSDKHILATLHQYRFILGMALYQQTQYFDAKHFEELFISYFYIQANANLSVPLDEETHAELTFSKREFQESIKHRLQEIDAGLVQKVLLHFKGDFKEQLTTLNISRKDDYVFSLEDKYEIDIENGAVYQGNKKISPVPMYMNHSRLFKHFKLDQESSCLMYPGDSIFEFVSPTGVLRFSRARDNSFRVQKEFSFGDGKTYWYELYPMNPQQKEQLSLENLCFNETEKYLTDAMTDGDMSAWSLCSGFQPSESAPQFILTQNHRPLFYAQKNTQFSAYETKQRLSNDPIHNHFDDPKFMICTTDHIFFKRYGLHLAQGSQGYVLQDKPCFVYQPDAKFPIPGVANLGFKEAYQKGTQPVERDYFIVPVQRFHHSNSEINDGEFFPFKHDASGFIAQKRLTKRWGERGLSKEDFPLWHYENTCQAIVFPIVNGEPKPEKAADALYLSYLYLAAGQPEKAWDTLQKIQQRFSLDGSYEELTYLEWIVNALPVVLDKEDKETVRDTPAYQACQLNALSLLTTFVMTGKRIEWPTTKTIDETTANGEYEQLCIDETKSFYQKLPRVISEKLNHYLNVERHLVQPFYLNESMIRSLLAYYTREANDIHGALGYRQRESTLATLVREKRLLEDNLVRLKGNLAQTAFIPLDLDATRKRLDEIGKEVEQQKDVMKRSTVLEKIKIDLTLPKDNIQLDTSKLSPGIKELYQGGQGHAGWYLSLGTATSGEGFGTAMKALSPDISEDEFVKYFPDYFCIAANPDDINHRKLVDFCIKYLIAHRHTRLKDRCENILLLVNLIYRRAHFKGKAYHSTLSGVISELRKQEHQLPPIEIYQARDVFKEPLADVQSIFESLSDKTPTIEASIPLPSKCRFLRFDQMPSTDILQNLKDPSYILTSTGFAYYYPLLNKIEIVTEEETLLRKLRSHFSGHGSDLFLEDFDAIHRITQHVPTSLLAETLADELQNASFRKFYQKYRQSENNYETQLGHQLDGLDGNPTFEQLEGAENEAGRLQHDHFNHKKQLAQILSDKALRQLLQQKLTAMQSSWQAKVSHSLNLLLDLSAELPDSPEEQQRINIARSTLKQSQPTEKDLLNLYYRALPSAYRESMGLSEEKIEKLHQHIHAYAQEKLHLQHVVRIQKALAQAESTPTEEQFLVLASTLMSKSQMSAQVDPAIMRFQLEENMLLRPRQIEALRSLLSPTVKSPHQFDERIEKIIMGGGKSKVLLPLMAQKKATGLNLVVVEVPHPLLKTNHADLNATSQKLFNQAAHIFQFDRDSDCSSGRLEEIYQQLLNIMTSKDYLITTGESVQSFRLKYLELLYSKPPEDSEEHIIEEWSAQIRSATKIVRLFKERSDVIIDEVHDGLLLKRKLNYAFGEPRPISTDVIQLNISLFVFLQSKLEFPKEINGQDEQERIKNNEKALKSHWQKLKADFPRMLIDSPESPLRSHVMTLCQGNPARKEALIRYLKDEETCDFLEKCGNKTILDAFAFFKAQQKILDVTLHKQYKENYGPSKIEAQSEIKRSLAIPYAGNNKSKESSQFSSQLETMNYTIQSLRLTGISRTMLNETVQQWLAQARYEMLQTKGVSLYETKIAQAVESHYLKRVGLRFEDLDIHNETLMEHLYSTLHQDNSLIYDILENKILPQINQEQRILSSNPLNHADIYRSRQGISGTPSNYRTFHQSLKFNPKTSLGTDGFIQNLLIHQKPDISVKPFTNLREFLSQVLASNPSITAIMDICATFTGYPAYDVARILAENYPDRFEYVLYFDGSDRLCAVSSANPDASPIILGTSDPDEITQRLGGCPLEKRFTYYDQLHTVGVDIKQAPNACGLALIDERTQLQAFLQGVMRMRGLETGQSIAVVAQHELSDLDDYLAHMQENEARQLKDDIFLSALEKIDNLYHNNLMLHLYACEDPVQQAFLAEKFKDFFLQTQQLDLYKQYGSVSQKMATEYVLKDYALNAFRRWEHWIKEAGIAIEEPEKESLLQDSHAVVEETLPHCSVEIEWHENNQEGQEYQNEKENQKEQQQQKEEQKDEEFFNPELREKQKLTWTMDTYRSFYSGTNSLPVKALSMFSTRSELMSLQQLSFDLPGIELSPSLLISSNYRDVYENQERMLSYYLKPVYAILFRLHEGKLSACLITNQELQEITELQEKEPSSKTWIVNLKSTALSGHLPDFLLQPKESSSAGTLPIYEQYYELMEQACFFAGEMKILSEREVPLTWITKHPDQKLDFFEKNLMAFRKTTPEDLIDIKTLFSTANKGYEYIKSNAFKDLTSIDLEDWKKLYPELNDKATRSLKKLSEIFHQINENPLDPMPDNAQDIYLAGCPTLPITALAYVEQHINLHRMMQMLTQMNQGVADKILSPLAQKILFIDYHALASTCKGDSDLLQFQILMACITSPLFNQEVLYNSCITENALIQKLDLASPFSEEDLLVKFLQKPDLSLLALTQLLTYPQSKKSLDVIFKHPLISYLSLSDEQFSSLLPHLSTLDLPLVFHALDKMPIDEYSRIKMKALTLTQFKVTEGAFVTDFIGSLSSIIKTPTDILPEELFLQLLKLEVKESSWLDLWINYLLKMDSSRVVLALSHLSLTEKEIDILAAKLKEQLLPTLFDKCGSKLSLPGLITLASRAIDVNLLNKLADIKPLDKDLAKAIWTNAVADDNLRKKLLSKIASLDLFQQCLMLSHTLNEDAIAEAAIANPLLTEENKSAIIDSRDYEALTAEVVARMPARLDIQLKILNEHNDASILAIILNAYKGELTAAVQKKCLASNDETLLTAFLPHVTETNVLEGLLEKNQTPAWHSNIARRAQDIGLVGNLIAYPNLEASVKENLLLSSCVSFVGMDNTTLQTHLKSVGYNPNVLLKILRECSPSTVASLLKTSFPKEKLTDELFTALLSHPSEEAKEVLTNALLDHVTTENEAVRLPILAEKNKTLAWPLKLVEKATDPNVISQCIPTPSAQVLIAMQNRWPKHFVAAPPPSIQEPQVTVTPPAPLYVEKKRDWNELSAKELQSWMTENKDKVTEMVVTSLLAKIDSIDSPTLLWLITSGELMRLQQLRPFVKKLQTFDEPKDALWIPLLKALSNPDDVTLVISSMNPQDEADYLYLLEISELIETDKKELINTRKYQNLEPEVARRMRPRADIKADVQLKILSECRNPIVLKETLGAYEGELSDAAWNTCLASNDGTVLTGLLSRVTKDNGQTLLSRLLVKNNTQEWHRSVVQKAKGLGLEASLLALPGLNSTVKEKFILQSSFAEKDLSYVQTQLASLNYNEAALLKVISECTPPIIESVFSGTGLKNKLTRSVITSLLATIDSIQNPVLSWLITSGELMRLQHLYPFITKLKSFAAPQHTVWRTLLKSLENPNDVELVITSMSPQDEAVYLSLLDISGLSDQNKSERINTRRYENLEPSVTSRMPRRADIQQKLLKECKNPAVLKETLETYDGELTAPIWQQCLAWGNDTVFDALLGRVTKENGENYLPRLLAKKSTQEWHRSVMQQAKNLELEDSLLALPGLNSTVKENLILQSSFAEKDLSYVQTQLASLKYSETALLKVISECTAHIIESVFSGTGLKNKLTPSVIRSLLTTIDSIQNPVLSWLITSGELMRLQQLYPFITKLKSFAAPQHTIWRTLLKTLKNLDDVRQVITSMNPQDEAFYLSLLDISGLLESEKITLILTRPYQNLDEGVIIKMLPYLASRPQGVLKIIVELQAPFSDQLFKQFLSYARDDLTDGVLDALLKKVSLDNEHTRLPLLARKNQTDAWRLRLVEKAQQPEVISQCISNPPPMIQQEMEKKWPTYFRQPIPPFHQTNNPIHFELPSPPEPTIDETIKDVVDRFVFHIEKIKSKKFQRLITSLKTLSNEYVKNKNLSEYKSGCTNALREFKPQLSNAARRSLTIFEHITEVLRVFFNVLDRIVSLFSSSTMADTYTPGAQRLVGRNHFFVQPNRETDLSRAMQAFEEKLSDLDNSGTSHSP